MLNGTRHASDLRVNGSSHTRAFLVAGCLSAVLGIVANAGAQPAPAEGEQPSADSEEAITIGRRALKLFDEREWRAAHDEFRRANALFHSPVFVLYMARCRAHLGELVEASAMLKQVAEEASAPTEPEPWHQARRDAALALASLQQRIPRLRIEVRPPRHELVTLTIDGNRVPLERIEQWWPVDPGVHTVRARDRSGREVRAVVSLAESRTAPAILQFPESKPPGQLPSRERVAATEPLHWPAITALSVGLVGIGVGSLTGVLAKQDSDAVHDGCDSNFNCDPSDESRAERGRRYAAVSTGSFIAGSILTAAGVVLFVWPPHRERDSRGALQVRVGAGGATLARQF